MVTATPDSINMETNVITLSASEDSKITAVSLYSGRAEVTRLFKFKIKAGQNKVTILELPRLLQEDSLRVEGRGNATIHDVNISKPPPTSRVSESVPGSLAEESLKRKRDETGLALETAKQSRFTLRSYLATVSATQMGISDLSTMLDEYNLAARKFDLQILDLEKELAEVEGQIQAESRSANAQPIQFWQVVINVHGQVDEDVKVVLKYAVYGANWTASYDIRADTQTNQGTVSILYKAAITQNTGEPWDDVPLTLETATPSFGISIPSIPSWNLTVTKTPPIISSIRESYRSGPVYAPSPAKTPSRFSRPHYEPTSPRYSPTSPTFSPTSPALDLQDMEQQVVSVSTKGNVAATFRVPGLITVPSDGGKHNVTISQLKFDAGLLWYTIPKADARVHLRARVQNESEYTFIAGPANIYVDGSFIAATRIPSVSPQETFDCPLGLDPSIRVTYHPRERKALRPGFLSRIATESFTQRITLLNSKSIAINNLKVTDAVPVSEDERIEVKLINPPLVRASVGNTSSVSTFLGPTTNETQKPLRVGESIIAQWDGVDEKDFDQDLLGKNGRLNWLLSLPPQKSLTLSLQYEVGFARDLVVEGLGND